MRKCWAYIRACSASDEADSTLVSAVIVLPFIFIMIITMLEVSILFENRSILQNDLRDGAAVVAQLGGADTAQSKVAATYGNVGACGSMTANTKSALESGWVSTDAATCETATVIKTNPTYMAGFNIYDITCGPGVTASVGTATYCEAKYNYTGIPGGSISLIGGTYNFGHGIVNNGSSDGDGHTSTSGIQYGHLRMSSQSEVCLSAACN